MNCFLTLRKKAPMVNRRLVFECLQLKKCWKDPREFWAGMKCDRVLTHVMALDFHFYILYIEVLT